MSGPVPAGIPGAPGGPPPKKGGSRTALVIVAVVVVLLLVGVGIALVASSGGGDDEDVETAQDRDEESTTTETDRDEDPDEDEDEPAKTTTTTEEETTTTEATTTTVPEEVWTTYTASDGCYSVDLPGTPEEIPLSPGDLGEPYVGGGGVSLEDFDSLYILFYFDLAPDYFVVDPAAALNGGLDGMVSAVPGFVVDSRFDTTFADIPALEFSGDLDGTPVEGIGLVSGQRMFYLLAGGEAGEYDFARFRDSLRINC
jgi:hypothetical protein